MTTRPDRINSAQYINAICSLNSQLNSAQSQQAFNQAVYEMNVISQIYIDGCVIFGMEWLYDE